MTALLNAVVVPLVVTFRTLLAAVVPDVQSSVASVRIRLKLNGMRHRDAVARIAFRHVEVAGVALRIWHQRRRHGLAGGRRTNRVGGVPNVTRLALGLGDRSLVTAQTGPGLTSPSTSALRQRALRLHRMTYLAVNHAIVVIWVPLVAGTRCLGC